MKLIHPAVLKQQCKRVDKLVRGFELVSYGLKSNFFGLCCPAHCSSPGLGSVLASFLLGFVFGVCLTAYLAWLFWTWTLTTTPCAAPSVAVPPDSSLSLSRLRQYLHEQQVSSSQRRRRH